MPSVLADITVQWYLKSWFSLKLSLQRLAKFIKLRKSLSRVIKEEPHEIFMGLFFYSKF
ncbi:hypothetical protein D3C87_516450 [compost metagenome]